MMMEDSGSLSQDIFAALQGMDPSATMTTGTASSFLNSLGMSAQTASAASGPSAEDLLMNTPAPPVTFAAPANKVAAAPAPVRVVQGSASSPLDAAAGAAAMQSDLYPHMRQAGVHPLIQNVVAMFNLGTKLNLKHIGLHAKNAEYNPKRFAAVIMRIREPKTTALIFESGKVVVTGAADEELCKKAAKKFAKIVVKLGFTVKFKDFRIQNIVGSVGVNFPLRLEMMAAEHAIFSSYEPELFPGLIYRMENPKVVLLIFVSGKIVLTGARSRSQVYEAFNKIYPILVRFDRNRSRGAGGGEAIAAAPENAPPVLHERPRPVE